MESYTSFAMVYDEFMDQTPYDAWHQNILDIFKKYDVPSQGKILELGCGTGKMTRRLASSGYDITAVDNSLEMLEIAGSSDKDGILYILQDMADLELPRKVDAAVSVCDCMNYLLEEEELFSAFQKVKKYLNPHGIFMFVMNSKYKYEHLLAQNTFAEDREDASFIWDNFYDEKQRINEYQLSLFIRNQEGTYNKYEEVHLQKAYEQEEVRELLKRAGFTEIDILDAETMRKPDEKTERLYYIAG